LFRPEDVRVLLEGLDVEPADIKGVLESVPAQELTSLTEFRAGAASRRDPSPVAG
jgi:hypothetical protein